MKKTLSVILSILLIFTIVGVSSVNATSPAVILKLLSQDPDPVKSGDEVTIRVGVENLGSKDLDNFVLEFVDSYPFSLFPDEQREVFIGKVFANQNGNSAHIVKFKIKVEDGIDEGQYPIKIRGKSQGTDFEREFLIEVNSKANAEISNISVDSLVPGEKTKISFTIKNVGKADLENIKFSWESQDDIILPVGSGNFKYLEKIEKDSQKTVDFYVVSDLSTEPKLYKLDLKLEYDDVESLQKITDAGTIQTDKRREVIAKAGIYVGGGTNFEISQKSSTTDSITLSIANIGSNLASSVVIKIPENQQNFKVTSSQSKVIGNIKKGAFGRAEFDIEKIGDNSKLDLIVEYTDTTGKRQSLNHSTKVSLSSFNEFENLQNQNQSSGYGFYLFLILAVIGMIWFIRKRKKNSNKNKN